VRKIAHFHLTLPTDEDDASFCSQVSNICRYAVLSRTPLLTKQTTTVYTAEKLCNRISKECGENTTGVFVNDASMEQVCYLLFLTGG
jgi:dihydroneopterin aldolase